MKVRSETEKKTRSAVIGVDFGEASLIAARWSARYLGPHIELVLAHALHVPEPPGFLRDLYPATEELLVEGRKGVQARLDEFATSLEAEELRREIRAGRPEDVLGDLVDEFEAELLVVGPRRQEAGIRRLMGNIAERSSRRSHASVLLARGLPNGPLRNIVVALDGSPRTPRIIEWGARLAQSGGGGARVVFVATPMTYESAPTAASSADHRGKEQEVQRRASEWLRAQVAGTSIAGAPVIVAFGDPGQTLVEAADQLEDSVLVVGRNGADSPEDTLLGRVAEFVLTEGARPVLVVGD